MPMPRVDEYADTLATRPREHGRLGQPPDALMCARSTTVERTERLNSEADAVAAGSVCHSTPPVTQYRDELISGMIQ